MRYQLRYVRISRRLVSCGALSTLADLPPSANSTPRHNEPGVSPRPHWSGYAWNGVQAGAVAEVGELVDHALLPVAGRGLGQAAGLDVRRRPLHPRDLAAVERELHDAGGGLARGVLAVPDEVPEPVRNERVPHPPGALQDVRVAADDQVDARFLQLRRQFTLVGVRAGVAFGAPVEVRHHDVGLRTDVADFLQ